MQITKLRLYTEPRTGFSTAARPCKKSGVLCARACLSVISQRVAQRHTLTTTITEYNGDARPHLSSILCRVCYRNKQRDRGETVRQEEHIVLAAYCFSPAERRAFYTIRDSRARRGSLDDARELMQHRILIPNISFTAD